MQVALLLLLLLQTAAPASDPQPEDVIVNGRIPHCRPLDNDPLDRVEVPSSERSQSVIKTDPESGVPRLLPDDDPITGPETWSRAGQRIDQYVFRTPHDDTPLCMGARPGIGAPMGHAQLRREIDAKSFVGRSIRVTMWAASRRAGRVWFWLAAGRSRKLDPTKKKLQFPTRADMAAETGMVEFSGDHRWTPVSLTLGPIMCYEDKFSYGALLEGPGDLWLYRPHLEVLPITRADKIAMLNCDRRKEQLLRSEKVDRSTATQSR